MFKGNTMYHMPHQAAVSASWDTHARALLGVLNDIAQRLEQLTALASTCRQTMQQHDAVALRENLIEQQRGFHALGELEKQRLGLAAHLTRSLEPKASTPLAMPQLQQRLPQDWAQAFAQVRETIQSRLKALQQQQRVNQAASASMHRHVTGLLQRFASLLEGDVYGPRGCRDRLSGSAAMVNVEA